jgi:hypothetical protein
LSSKRTSRSETGIGAGGGDKTLTGDRGVGDGSGDEAELVGENTNHTIIKATVMRAKVIQAVMRGNRDINISFNRGFYNK